VSILRRLSILTVSLLALFPGALAAQVQVKAGSAELKFSGRLQFQMQTTTCTDATPALTSPCGSEEPGLDMFMRRARFSIEAKIDDRITLKVEPDYSKVGEVSLKDAWGRYRFSPLVSLKAGHFKRPFDGFQLTSSSWLPFERAVTVPGVSSSMLHSYGGFTKSFDLGDRDIGFMFEGETQGGGFNYSLGAFTGNSGSKANDTNSEKQFIGRAGVALDVGGSPLNVAGAVALTDAPFTNGSGEMDAEYFSNFELFAELGEYGRDGLVVQTGLIIGDNPTINPLGGAIDLAGGDDFASLMTWQGAVGYRIPTESADWLEAVAPVIRVSYADPNTDVDDDEVWGLTPGFTLYFHKRNRLMLTYDVASFAASGTDSESSFTAQMQFHF